MIAGENCGDFEQKGRHPGPNKTLSRRKIAERFNIASQFGKP
jgi:hypothetical protein